MSPPPARRRPAEWEPHEATLLAFPADGRDWPGKFGAIRWAFVEFMLARRESQLKMLKKCDSFPALEKTYDDPYFKQPMAFYGDQAVLGLFAELAREILPWYYTEDYPAANGLCSAEIQAYLMGSKDAKAALAAAASAIRAKTGRR